ncbi:hypothetical protein [Caulobacter segnis]|uniref:Rieske domain-containing protein n=1 Tax=Caulobacter segnis TaxID=88688 RepID=A0A2W5V9G1_9CAUL|nr:hypothetical protein [Caulobacter segnis]PZR36450.1 MAG: hypothetical protein DI526_03160 [Caulobacter segnis]
MIERITNLSAPPIVGRFYLVPTVELEWYGLTSAWPVFLPKHEDARFFQFEHDHYHIDPRFLGARQWRFAGGGRGAGYALDRLQRAPLSNSRWDRKDKPLPPIAWKRVKCSRLATAYQHGDQPNVGFLRQHYAGHQCKRARSGWVCPHQNWPMGSLEPDADGFITCPLHGLRVRASDGIAEPGLVPALSDAA